MRSTSLLISILLAFTSFGQPSPINRRAFALTSLASTSTPLLAPNMRFRWRAPDVTNSPMTIWTDEIQGYNITTNGTAGQGPTWDTNHVIFNGSSQYAILTNVNIQQSNACLVIMTPAAHNNQVIISAINDRILGINSSVWVCGGDPMAGHVADNKPVDMFFAGGAAGSYQIFTNGVLMNTGVESATGVWTNWGRFANNTEYYNGSITEVIVWYNSLYITNNLPVSVSNCHYYATNLSPIAPYAP